MKQRYVKVTIEAPAYEAKAAAEQYSKDRKYEVLIVPQIQGLMYPWDYFPLTFYTEKSYLTKLLSLDFVRAFV